MTTKEAIDYLRPIMESATLPRYQEALRLAVEVLEEALSQPTNEAVTAIETLLAERDAAVLDLHYMHALCMKIGFSCPECDSRIDDLLMSACAFCKNREMACWKDGLCGDFEWRGPRKWFLPQKGDT